MRIKCRTVKPGSRNSPGTETWTRLVSTWPRQRQYTDSMETGIVFAETLALIKYLV